MDYSASIHDADHPAGASPWGNSPAASPQPNQTTFGTLGGGHPPASPPAFESQISGNGFGVEHEDPGFNSPDHGFGRRPDTASTAAGSDTQAQATTTARGDTSAGQQRPAMFQEENESPSLAHDPNRLSGDTVRASQEQAQARKPTQPQYKLQAKITGLERAARKDPILRFDVHVSSDVPLLFPCTPRSALVSSANPHRPISPSSEQLNSETSGVCTPSSSSWLST